MNKRALSEELTLVFEYIRDVVCAEHPHAMVNEYAYILASLHCEDSLAYKTLSSIVMETTLEQMKEFFDYQIKYTVNDSDDNKSPYTVFDNYFNECNSICDEYDIPYITSSVLLLSIIKEHEEISKQFRDFAVTAVQLLNSVTNQTTELINGLTQAPKKHIKKKKNELVNLVQPIKVIEKPNQFGGEVERNLINLSKLSSIGKIPTVINYGKYYDEIFTILSKKNRNNVVVCGKSGVGKTATVKNLANIIKDRKCHQNFHSKILMEMDFSRLVVGTPFKGAFEQKFYTILEDARLNGNYIFFIDNMQMLLNGNTKYAETDMESLLEILLAEPSIQVICTMTSKAFSTIQKKSILGKYLQEVTIEEPSIEETIQILNKTKSQYENYHDVSYSEEAISECVRLCDKYINTRALPDSALDTLDVVGAHLSMSAEELPVIKNLKSELANIISEIETIKSSSETKEYEKIDALVKKQIALKSQLAIFEKEKMFSKEPTPVSKNDIASFISKKVDIPLEDLTTDEKIRLKGLTDKIKEKVIGQDEAVEEVCRVVKRQRVGLGANERPAVLMFLGSTGTGKTYLAKQLAKEVFGDEKYFVRMDMSEYADKTSVNKISGSSHGYVGYEDDTFLVRALKKKKRFVLLLDEFEKSSEEVHNIFLQIFDEGRFTDNHGEEYSLKDVIIIMTTNVGVAEAANRGRAIGFGTTDYDVSKEIIEKEMKRKFKPEFINRVQKIVFFNKLEEENLKSIIALEIEKVNDKVEKLGYHLSTDITKTTMVDDIFKQIVTKKEYGARPIVNEVQRKIEDRIVDYLIDNEVENGHTFTYCELNDLVF